MAIGSSLTLLTLLTIGTLAENGEYIREDTPQDLGIKCCQNVNAADTQSQIPLPSLWELKLKRLDLGPVVSLSPQVIGCQPESRPQYKLAPTTQELDVSLSSRLPANLLHVDQSQPKPPIWIISIPPSQSPLYLALVPQNYNPAPHSFTQSPADWQESKSQNLAEDLFIQSLYNLSKIESEVQTISVQIRDLQSTLQTISDIEVDSLSQYREEKSVLLSLLQSLTKNSSAQAYISESPFQFKDATVNSLDPSYNAPSYSGSQSQYQNQTFYNSIQSSDFQSQFQLQNPNVNSLDQLPSVPNFVQPLSQFQLQNQTANNLVQSNQFQLQNQTVNSLGPSYSLLQSQNQTVPNTVPSNVSLSQFQLQNQTENNLVQPKDSQLKFQLPNQTVNSLGPSYSLPGTQLQIKNQTDPNLVQSQGFQSQSQFQNQTVSNLDQSNGTQSQYQLQNQTQSGSQSQFQNQTVVQSYITLSQSQLQNQTVQNLVQSNDSPSQSQLPNQSVNSLDQSPSQLGSESQTQNQTQNNSVQSPDSQSLSQLPNQTVNISTGLPETGTQSDSQNQTTQSQWHNQTSIITTINTTLTTTLIKTIKYVIESPPPFFTSSDIKDDSDLQTFGLVEKYGYPSETRYVYTEDGYKLCLHRIPRPGSPSVLLVHGLMSSSVSWVQFGPTNGLAYILYRKGYDVWMLNTRGNIYSREHTKKNLKPRDYWDFSFHEIGKFDLPAAIDLILKINQQPKIQYIGHSQGSTVFFVMCSERPEYASKVNLMQSLAPTVYLQNALSPVLKFLRMFKGKFSMLVNLLGGYEISSKTRLIKQFRDHICSTSELASRICTIFDFVLCGFDWKGFNETLTPIVAAHASQGASAKQIYHYAQMQGKLNFQLFDHGRILNHIRYNDDEPPRYNLSLAATKVVIYHSSGDWLGVESDVGHLEKMLPNVVESRKIQIESFAHFDFTISKDVRPLVYDSVLGHLENHR